LLGCRSGDSGVYTVTGKLTRRGSTSVSIMPAEIVVQPVGAVECWRPDSRKFDGPVASF
jgi:hypothetical protein